MKIELIQGHILDALATLPSDSVDCIVSSPPYWGLRNYGKETEAIWDAKEACKHEWNEQHTGLQHENRNNLKGTQEEVHLATGTAFIKKYDRQLAGMCSLCGAWKGQLGMEPDYRLFIKHMLSVTSELKRVLKPSGTLWWNIGDTYNGNKEGKTDKKVSDYVKEDQNGLAKFASTHMQDKCLMLIPERLTIGMVDQGWTLRNKIVWHKPNHMPSSVKDRLTNSWEYVYLFVKSRKYYFNLDAIRVQPTLSSITEMQPSGKFEQDGSHLEVDYKYPADVIRRIGQDRLDGVNPFVKGTDAARHGNSFNQRVPDALKGRLDAKYGDMYKATQAEIESYDEKNYKTKMEAALARQGSYEDPLHTMLYDLKGKNPGDIWRITTQPFKDAHFATFPEALVKECLLTAPREICSKCGKGKVPVTETEYVDAGGKGNEKLQGADAFTYAHYNSPEKYRLGLAQAFRNITGYRPQCQCNAPFTEPTIMDPFCGSATTLKVAKEMHMSGIGIEISPKYIKIAKRRLQFDSIAKLGLIETELKVIE